MAYRGFNRALGETSLEVKCLSLFGLFLALVITVSFFLHWWMTEKVVYGQNPQTGRLLVDQVMLCNHWKALAKAPPGEEEDPFLLVVQELTSELTKQEVGWRLIRRPDSPKARDESGQPRDTFERDLFKQWLVTKVPDDTKEGVDDTPDFADRFSPNGDQYQYYQAIRVQSLCLAACHRPVAPVGSRFFDYEGVSVGSGPRTEGDLKAILQVTIPTDRTKAAVNLYWNILLAVAIITAFLAMIAFYLTIRYVIVRPLRHLHHVSDAISHGNIAMRADINTGDEFESLAVAFNRMLRHLVTIQDELRQANVKLDGKVDELAQVNMQLYEMNRTKSDFMATMSHELRTPLNSILGFSDVLAAIDVLDEKQKRYVRNIQKSGQVLLDMINNILDLAKIESGKVEIQLDDFDLSQLILTQCDMARPLTAKKNIDLDAEIQPGLPPMHQDQGRVRQILNNLLSNAIKFTPEGGRIRVTAHRDQNGVLILKVIDTGVGIAEEDQQVVFEKFRQGGTAAPGGDAMTREYSGTGLGLSIVKELCKLLEGEIFLESALGTGSTFSVRLPWNLERRPPLDSPAAAGMDDFAKSWLDSRHETAIAILPAEVRPEPVDDEPST